MAIVAGFANLHRRSRGSPTAARCASSTTTSPRAPYFPTALNGFSHPEFNIVDRAGLRRLSASSASGWPTRWYFRGLGPHGITERNRLARAGHRVLVKKYYLDWLYTDVIVGGRQGPHRPRPPTGSTRRCIDGVVDGAGAGAVAGGQFVYDKIDQGVVDTIVNGSGAAAEGSGQGLRRIQTGRVQQYAALLFAATAVFAGIFIIVI